MLASAVEPRTNGVCGVMSYTESQEMNDLFAVHDADAERDDYDGCSPFYLIPRPEPAERSISLTIRTN
jgi:hypothetical protein